jgi:GT2 family glycosyltransferase
VEALLHAGDMSEANDIERETGGARRVGTAAAGRRPARVAIVIVSYNTRKLVRRCLESLQAWPPRTPLDVIVVDNASRDGSVEMLQSEFPAVRVVANRRNLGYSAAVNIGIEASSADYVLVLNPDIVIREGAIDRMVEFMDANPEAGIAAAKLVNTDGSLQYSCRSFYTPMTLLMRRTPLGKLFPDSRIVRRHLMLDYDHAAPRIVDWVIGACMLARRAAIEAVGGMDERFFLYFEDVDWCFRMSRQGWKVWYLPQAEMVHEHRRESARPRLSRSFWAHLGSLLRFYEKWNRWAYVAKRYREVVKVTVFALADLAATNLAFLGAYELRVIGAHRFRNPLYTLENYHNFWIFTNIVVLLALYFSSQYRIGRGKRAADELFEVGRALFLAVVVIMASTYITRERLISRAVVVMFFFLATLLVWLFRRGLRGLHARLLEMHLDLRRLAIVGSEEEARELRQLVAARPTLGLDVVGHVTVGEAPRRALGSLDGIGDVVRVHRIQQVLVAPSAAQVENVARMLLQLRRRAVEVQVMSGFADLLRHTARVERLADVPVSPSDATRCIRCTPPASARSTSSAAGVLLLVGLVPSMLYCLVARLRGVAPYRTETLPGPRRLPVRNVVACATICASLPAIC